MDGFSDRRSLNPEVSGSLGCVGNFSSWLERLRTKAGFLLVVSNRRDTFICIKNILVKMGNVVVPNFIAEIHVVPLKEIFKRLIVLRVHNRTELVYSKSSTVIDST